MTEGAPHPFEAQLALHDEGRRAADVAQAMALFHALLVETARWDAVRGVDPLERWRADKEAQGAIPPPP